jgi:hypothetical protein
MTSSSIARKVTQTKAASPSVHSSIALARNKTEQGFSSLKILNTALLERLREKENEIRELRDELSNSRAAAPAGQYKPPKVEEISEPETISNTTELQIDAVSN